MRILVVTLRRVAAAALGLLALLVVARLGVLTGSGLGIEGCETLARVMLWTTAGGLAFAALRVGAAPTGPSPSQVPATPAFTQAHATPAFTGAPAAPAFTGVHAARAFIGVPALAGLAGAAPAAAALAGASPAGTSGR